MSVLRFWSMAHLPTGGSATGLSATDACILSYDWPVMPETVRLFWAEVERFRFVCYRHGAFPHRMGRLVYRPQSSSASRFTAGAFAFFILSQSGERPER